MRTLAALALAAGLFGAGWAGAAGAEAEDDFLVADGPLSPDDFYRLVSCRAPPGGECEVESVAWAPERAQRLTVDVAPAPAGYPRDMAARVGRAVDDAIREINGAGAGLHLVRARGDEPADVVVHLSPAREGEPVSGVGIPGVDGETLGAALVTIWWDEAGAISDAVVIVASDLRPAEVASVVLEELTQAMGLMTDIRDPYYEGLSVFSEDSNAALRLGPQDVEALRTHYPPGDP